MINNKKAYYIYEIIEKEIAGVCLIGSEVKPLRSGEGSISESFIFINDSNEMFIKNMYVKPSENNYKSYSRDPYSDRKLLLTKKQIKKFKEKLDTKGLTIIPLKIFFNEKGLCKMEIALAKGKKLYDKRKSLKQKELKKEIDKNSI